MISYNEDFPNLFRVFQVFWRVKKERPIDEISLISYLGMNLKATYQGAPRKKEVIKEIRKAQSSTMFSWKKMAEESQFYSYDENITDEEILINFQALTWPHFFPEELLSESEAKLLLQLCLQKMIFGKWMNFNEIIELVSKETTFSKKLELYFIRNLYFWHHGIFYFEYKHDIGTLNYFYKLVEVPDYIYNESYEPIRLEELEMQKELTKKYLEEIRKRKSNRR